MITCSAMSVLTVYDHVFCHVFMVLFLIFWSKDWISSHVFCSSSSLEKKQVSLLHNQILITNISSSDGPLKRQYNEMVQKLLQERATSLLRVKCMNYFWLRNTSTIQFFSGRNTSVIKPRYRVTAPMMHYRPKNPDIFSSSAFCGFIGKIWLTNPPTTPWPPVVKRDVFPALLILQDIINPFTTAGRKTDTIFEFFWVFLHTCHTVNNHLIALRFLEGFVHGLI